MRRLAAALIAVACANAAPDVSPEPIAQAPAAPSATPPDPAEVDKGRDDFRQIARVLASPRCRNCHPVGDAPLQSDLGRPHAMNVTRTSAESGLPCTTCHRDKNSKIVRGPPGVPNWHMPSREMPMVFEKKSSRELCEGLKDPAQNGGRGLAQIREHLAKDPLVLWGWDPGPGRTHPPISHADFVRHVDAWIASGAPCP